MSDRYPNQVPRNRRHGYFNKDSYESGVIRDGHKIVRDPEGSIDVEHPEDCPREVTDYGGGIKLSHHTCPWSFAAETGIPDSYAHGDDALRAIAEERLPVDEPVEVNWSMESGATWTDYGWEYDATFSWWFPGDPAMQEPAAA